jgi:beta-lysine 5,6-aminomutase beta subunit
MKQDEGTNIVRAYGDRLGDGAVQLSFTLPLPVSPRAREAAICFAQHLGLKNINVATAESAGDGYSYFVLYGHSNIHIDVDLLDVPEVQASERSMEEVDALIAKELGRQIVVVGACTGADAHTVGIDAILNMKGYAGDYGLERYAGFDVYNMGGQVSVEEFLAKASAVKADALLLSKVVTQRGVHKKDAARVVEALKEAGMRDQVLLIVGGPRVDHKLALELGFDAGFGRGTRPSQVANFIVDELLRRRKPA